MPEPITAGLPPDLVLGAGYVIRLAALNPTTGATVAGVTLSNVSIFVRNVGEGAVGDLTSGPWLLVPGAGA